MTIEDPFEFDPVRESRLASIHLGKEVVYVEDVTHDPVVGVEVDTSMLPPLPADYATYYDDRAHSTSVRAVSSGLPSLGRRN